MLRQQKTFVQNIYTAHPTISESNLPRTPFQLQMQFSIALADSIFLRSSRPAGPIETSCLFFVPAFCADTQVA